MRYPGDKSIRRFHIAVYKKYGPNQWAKSKYQVSIGYGHSYWTDTIEEALDYLRDRLHRTEETGGAE